MANSLLESFGEPPPQGPAWQISAIPNRSQRKRKPRSAISLFKLLASYRGSRFVFQPFDTFDLSAMQVCNPQEIRQAHSQYPRHSRVSLDKIPSLTWLHTFCKLKECYKKTGILWCDKERRVPKLMIVKFQVLRSRGCEGIVNKWKPSSKRWGYYDWLWWWSKNDN